MQLSRYFSILRSHQRPYRFLLGRLLVRTGFSRFFVIRQSGYRLRFFPSNLTEQLWVDPAWRDEALDFFRVYLRPGDTVVDVGANIGDTVITSSQKVGAAGKVWAVEPHPRTHRFLTENLQLNRCTNVQTFNCAVGDKEGTVQFADDRRDDMNKVGGGDVTVPIKRLDDLISGADQIALLKVDVEGYEKPVLEGASRVLARTKAVHIEVSTVHFSWFGYEVKELLQILRGSGFDLYRTPTQGTLEQIDVDFVPSGVENLVCVRELGEFQSRTGWTLAKAQARSI
jgi:FkbM family methyltransferase